MFNMIIINLSLNFTNSTLKWLDHHPATALVQSFNIFFAQTTSIMNTFGLLPVVAHLLPFPMVLE